MTRRGSIALLVVSFAALVVGVASGLQTQAYTRCQARWNEQSALSARERAAAADQDRAADQAEVLADRAEAAATRTLILTVFNAKGPDQARAAFAAYETSTAAVAEQRQQIAAQRAEADRQRQINPLPPLPSETCG